MNKTHLPTDSTAMHIVAYFLKARTVTPAKTRCYSTTDKQVMTSLIKKLLLFSTR
jgi:hypothetical protein